MKVTIICSGEWHGLVLPMEKGSHGTKPCELPLEEAVTFMPPLHGIPPMRPFLHG